MRHSIHFRAVAKASVLLCGASVTAIALVQPAYAVTQEDILRRLDALESKNSKLARENAVLRDRMQHVERSKVVVKAEPAKSSKGNAVQHVGIAQPPAPDARPPLLAIGSFRVNAPDGIPTGAFDATTVSIYGHADLSIDAFNTGAYDSKGYKWSVASNLTYLGFRVRHDLTDYGFANYAVIAQIESLVDASSQPSERAALGTRDTFLGIEGPYGALKIGKGDTPYKRATASFDPFSTTVADYNSIMGNTGGDIRAEFDYRSPRAIWYDTPIINGFQFSVMAAAGGNPALDNSAFPFGDFNCSASNARGSGSGFPNATQGFNVPNTGGVGGQSICTDGAIGDLYSTSLVYKKGSLTAIGAFEFHRAVNRMGDLGPIIAPNPGGNIPTPGPTIIGGNQVVTGQGVANEYAGKIGLGYLIDDPLGELQAYGIYEIIRRDGQPAQFNERSRDSAYGSVTQTFGKSGLAASFAYARAFKSGSPGFSLDNNINASDTATATGYAQNLVSNAADQYSAGLRYSFSKFASVYLVGTDLVNGPGAHYVTGASGHGIQYQGRDAFNQILAGGSIRAISSGLTLNF